MVRTGSGTSTTTTLYLGGAEKVIAPDGSYTYKRYVSPGVLIEQAHDSSGSRTSEDVRYLLYDHLGSPDVVTDAAGTVVQDLSFDAWGQRRAPNDWTTLALLRLADTTHGRYTPRGFTGHEMLDAVGIIHMNGRIYDPKLARFLQADPVIQFPHHAQSYNRYSYVLNNPLAYTDPSGYFIGKLFKKLFGGLNKLFGDFAPFLSIALLAIPGMQVWVMESWIHAFGFGFITGGIASGSLRGAVFGGISAAAFYGIGEQFSAADGFFQTGGPEHILAHGLTGGVLAELQGGDFGHGFLAAGLSKAVMGRFKYDDLSAPAVLTRTAIAAVVGGTISHITGGKFANGALTSAMAQLFNAEATAKEQGISQASENNAEDRIPEAGVVPVFPELLLLPAGRLLRGIPSLWKAVVVTPMVRSRLWGPKGPVFGTSHYRGRGNAGVLNKYRPLRFGWSFNEKTGRINLSLRVGTKWHSDKYFNPISAPAPPLD